MPFQTAFAVGGGRSAAQFEVVGGGFGFALVVLFVDVAGVELGIEPGFYGSEGAAAGGFVAGVFVADGQVVGSVHALGEADEFAAACDVLLLDLGGLAVLFGAVGRLKTFFRGLFALFGAGGREDGVGAVEAGVHAAIFAARFPCGFGHFEFDQVFAGEMETDDAAFAVAVLLVFDGAVEVAEVAALAGGVEGKTLARDADAAGLGGAVVEGVVLGGS